MKVQVLDIGVAIGRYPAVLGLTYDLDSLTVAYHPDNGDLEVDFVFDSPSGFRCLDERDLLTYWEHKELVDDWCFEVMEGGWMDLESSQGVLLSKELGCKEFLICGQDDCISVIADEAPQVILRSAKPKLLNTATEAVSDASS